MGDKQPSVRTLETGEKVTHYPDGRQILLPTNSLADALVDQAQDQETAGAELRDQLVEAATRKREAMGAGDPVPADKRAI